MESDTTLMQRVSEGDGLAMRTVYERFAPMIVTLAMRKFSRADAEDIAHETMISVWFQAKTFDRKKSAPGTWITTIAKRKMVDMWRRSKARIKSVPIELADGVVRVGDPRDDIRNPEVALSRMTDKQRRIFDLCMRGMTYPQIAKLDGIPIGTIKSTVDRARKKAGREKAKEGI